MQVDLTLRKNDFDSKNSLYGAIPVYRRRYLWLASSLASYRRQSLQGGLDEVLLSISRQ